jgi:hypothetical protein
LNVDRLIEPELQVDGVVDVLRRSVADDGQNRIERHDPADQEGDGGQADEGERQGRENPQEAHKKAHGGRGARRPPWL